MIQAPGPYSLYIYVISRYWAVVSALNHFDMHQEVAASWHRTPEAVVQAAHVGKAVPGNIHGVALIDTSACPFVPGIGH